MKLHNRHAVEGTVPPIYIGHRQFRDKKSGQMQLCKQWHAEYNLGGKKFDESLKTSNKTVAIRAAHRIVERIEKGEVRQIQRRAEWQEMYDSYIEFVKSRGRGPKTIEKYGYVLTALIEFAKKRKRFRPESMTPTDFWAFNGFMLNEEKLHRKTVSCRLLIVKSFFKWAVAKARMIRENPIADEEVEEAESDAQPCFNPKQIMTLLASADRHHAPIYAVMAYLGLRFGEVRDLRWSDFDFDQGDHGWVNISRGGSMERTKGRASRRIPVNQALRKYLDALDHHEDGRVFHQQPSSHYPEGGRPLSERRLLKSLKRLCKRCKFDDPNQYKLHTFRHAFASMLARNRIAYKQALAWMGHKDSKILDLYIRLFDEDAQEAMKSVDYSERKPNPTAA
jgi:integrase